MPLQLKWFLLGSVFVVLMSNAPHWAKYLAVFGLVMLAAHEVTRYLVLVGAP